MASGPINHCAHPGVVPRCVFDALESSDYLRGVGSEVTAVWAVDTSHESPFGTRYLMKAFRRPPLGRDDEILIDVDLQLAIRALDALIGWLSRLGHLLFPCAAPRPDRILVTFMLKVNHIPDWR